MPMLRPLLAPPLSSEINPLLRKIFRVGDSSKPAAQRGNSSKNNLICNYAAERITSLLTAES